MEPQGDERAMRREIGVGLGVLVTINATIGTGIFATPAQVAREAGSVEVYLLVWLVGGAMALCGALTLAELSAAMPRTGGLYEYLRRAWGAPVAFLFGWANLTVLVPSAVGSFGRIAAEALAALLDLDPDPDRDTAVAIGVIAVCAAANLGRVRHSAGAQAIVSAAKYAGVVLLAVLGLSVMGGPYDPGPPVDQGALPAASWSGAFTALVAVMWVYDGWGEVTRIAGEVRDPGRTLPRALVAGTLAVLLVYLLAHAGYLNAIGFDGLRHSTTGSGMAAANLAGAALGAPGRVLVSALVLVSCVGICMSTLLTMPRTFVPLAADGLFFRRFGAVSPRSGAPTAAVVLCAALGAAYVLVRSFEQLSSAFVVGFFPFYMLAVVGVFVLRRREPALPRPFRVPGYPVVPLIFLAGATALMIGAVTDADQNALYALGVVALGIPVHLAWRR